MLKYRSSYTLQQRQNQISHCVEYGIDRDTDKIMPLLLHINLKKCAAKHSYRCRQASGEMNSLSVFVGGNHSQPISHIVELQEFLGQVLQVPACIASLSEKAA